jgi:transposase
MIPSAPVQVWAYTSPTDLRKGFNGLYGLVVGELQRDPLDGEVFLFVNRRRTNCKALHWDGTGLCVFAKQLERGRFANLWMDDSKRRSLTSSELQLFIEGCTSLFRQRLSHARAVPKPLAWSARHDLLGAWTWGSRGNKTLRVYAALSSPKRRRSGCYWSS